MNDGPRVKVLQAGAHQLNSVISIPCGAAGEFDLNLPRERYFQWWDWMLKRLLQKRGVWACMFAVN